MPVEIRELQIRASVSANEIVQSGTPIELTLTGAADPQSAQASIRMMREVAEQDMQACSENGALIVSKMRSLEKDRIDNLLRCWISKSGAKMPTTSRLAEISKQLFCAKQDARLSVVHGNVAIHRYQDKISIDNRHSLERMLTSSVELVWQGEEVVNVPQFGGKLQFFHGDYGLEKSQLLNTTLTIHHRRQGDRLRLANNRPSRDMKRHYQAQKIPFWQREKLPFVSMQGQLLFAAGIGMESALCKIGKSMIHFHWIAD